MSIHGRLARKAAQAELRWCIGWSFGFYWLPPDAEESHVPGTLKHTLGDRGRQKVLCWCVLWGSYESRVRFSDISVHFLDSVPHWRRNQEPGLHSNRATVQEVGRWQGLPKRQSAFAHWKMSLLGFDPSDSKVECEGGASFPVAFTFSNVATYLDPASQIMC